MLAVSQTFRVGAGRGSVMVSCYRPRVKITRSSWLTDNLNCCDFEDARGLLPSFRLDLDGLRLTFTLGGETLVERGELDHRSLVGSAADLLGLVARRHLELDPLAIDLGDLRFGANGVTDRRRGKMADVDRAADRALPRLQIGPDRVEGGVFHHHDHDGRRQYLRQHRVLELVGEMPGLYAQRERAFRSRRNLAHFGCPPGSTGIWGRLVRPDTIATAGPF